MSMLTPCNLCNLKRIRARAKAEGKKVTVLSDAKWGLEGKNVYVHSPDVNIRKMEGGADGPRAKFRVAWMMEIPKACCC